MRMITGILVYYSRNKPDHILQAAFFLKYGVTDARHREWLFATQPLWNDHVLSRGMETVDMGEETVRYGKVNEGYKAKEQLFRINNPHSEVMMPNERI